MNQYIKNCSVNGCTRTNRVTRNLCWKHYQRWLKYGDPNCTLVQMHGMSRTYYARVWYGIKRRTCNMNSPNYANYGGRGIKVHEPWRESFKAFYDYIIKNIGERPDNTYTLDRKDNDGNYEPGNIKWSSPSEQNKNRRRMKLNPRNKRGRYIKAS
jgi:hypothetical protein